MSLDQHVQLQAIRDELERIEEDCIHTGKAHFNAGSRWSYWHYWIGIPSILLSSAAGAAFFKDMAEVGGGLSAAAAILTTLMTFLKPFERATKHKGSGDQYLAIRNDSRVFRTVRLPLVCDLPAAIAGLDELTNRRNELNRASLAYSARDFEKARKGIASGESLHRVDKGRR